MTRRRAAGFTLLEVMVALGIMAFAMTVAWGTISRTMHAKRTYGAEQDRWREVRNAMARMDQDFSMAYLSANEDRTITDTRTMFVGEGSGDFDTVKFSALVHRRLYADANESDQALIEYYTAPDPDHPGWTDLMRREARRLESGKPVTSLDTETDILLTDVKGFKLSYLDVKPEKYGWQDDTWTTQNNDGQPMRLPSLVKIKVTFTDVDNKGEIHDVSLVEEARINMSEVLQFYAN